MHTSGTIRAIQAAPSQRGGREQLLVLNGTNNIMLHELTKGAESVYARYTNAAITGIAFSQDGSYIAVAGSGGLVQIGMQLYFSNDFLTTTMQGHTTGAYTLSFSPDNNYIASGAEDGTIRVNRYSDRALVAKEPFDHTLGAPIMFSPDSKSIFSAEDATTLTRRAVTGATFLTENKAYPLHDTIKDFALIKNGAEIAVLTVDDRFTIFNIETQEETGFIPRLSNSALMDFAFSPDSTELLLGYEDGNVIRVKLDMYLVPVGAEVQVVLPQLDPNSAITGMGIGGGNGAGSGAGDGAGGVVFGYELPPEPVRNWFDISFAAAKYPAPYGLAFLFDAGFMHCLWSLPVYIGGKLTANLGIPSFKFPYTYITSDGRKLPQPYLLGFGVAAPVGYLHSFLKETITVLVQLEPCVTANLMYAPGVAVSRLALAAAIGLRAGVEWKYMRIDGFAQFGTITGFVFGGGVGVRIPYRKRSRA